MWRPSGTKAFHAIKPGAPFFFRLKAPHFAVAGFGYFAHFSKAPLFIAWEAFGDRNGAASFEKFQENPIGLKKPPLMSGEDPVIGCVMIFEPVLFPKCDWVEAPSDFANEIVSGKAKPPGRDFTSGRRAKRGPCRCQ